MPRISCDGREIDLAPGDNLLDALLAAGFTVPSSCRAGACQQCLVKATRGTPPAPSQEGLKAPQRDQGYLLACQAHVVDDLTLSLSGARELDVPAHVVAIERLTPEVLRVLVQPREQLDCRAGQYLTLVRPDGLSRSYSIARTLPERCLELHVRIFPHGQMSGWLARDGTVGSAVAIRGPIGDCFYMSGQPSQPLLLAGTGTGLAPLWGILHDALAANHTGPIELWHGARDAEGLYLVRELEALSSRHPQLVYRRCILRGRSEAGTEVNSLDAAVLASATSFDGRRVFLCGDPALVQRLKRQVFLKGASLREIHADAFVASASVAAPA